MERDPFDDVKVDLAGSGRMGNEEEEEEEKGLSSSGEEEDVATEEVEEIGSSEDFCDSSLRACGPGDNTATNGSSHLTPSDSRNNTQAEKSTRQNQDPEDPVLARRRTKLPWRERIRHFTWTWFCLTMATGGIANVLHAVPFRFHGLYALGCIFFIGNMVLFLFNVAMISCRFYLYPRTFKASFLHPTESLFIPAAIVSFGIIMMNISQYGVGMVGEERWLQHVMIVLFWVDCGLAIVLSLVVYLIMFVGPSLLLCFLLLFRCCNASIRTHFR